MICLCRKCNGEYDTAKCNSPIDGYCGKKCVSDRARQLGFKPDSRGNKGPSQKQLLERFDEIGHIEKPAT